MHWNALQKLIWSIFCEVFLTIAVAQLHFLKFSQWLRSLLGGWAELQNQYAGIVEQFYYIFSKPFPVLWLYQQTQQSSKYFALYEELGNSVLVLPMVTPLRSETELLGGSQLWPLNGSSGKAPSPRFASSLTGVQPQHSGFWLKALIR